MSRFFKPPGHEPPAVSSDVKEIDLTKRYDVYRLAGGSTYLVHRNVLIRGVRKLCARGDPHFSVIDDLYELEQPNDQIVYVSRHMIMMLCEHGTEILVEAVPLD
jgi:hypothetical protein